MKSLMRKMGREAVSVVNFESMNRVPPMPQLREVRGEIVPGMENVWYEYVPNSYDPEKKTPLVVSMHGGLMTGWGQAVYTSWTLVADREGFIVVFPNAASKRMWMRSLPIKSRTLSHSSA